MAFYCRSVDFLKNRQYASRFYNAAPAFKIKAHNKIFTVVITGHFTIRNIVKISKNSDSIVRYYLKLTAKKGLRRRPKNFRSVFKLSSFGRKLGRVQLRHYPDKEIAHHSFVVCIRGKLSFKCGGNPHLRVKQFF